jgi:hypothetical protein
MFAADLLRVCVLRGANPQRTQGYRCTAPSKVIGKHNKFSYAANTQGLR